MADRLMAEGLTFRQGDLRDPAAWASVASLLADIFGIDVTPLDQMGGPDPSSMAFSWFAADGQLAANLSAFALPMTIDGRTVNAAGLQSGAVRPEFRTRGLFRDVTEKALDWCDAQGFEAVLLYTEKPALYNKHGFAILPQSRFVAEATTTGRTTPQVHPLNLRKSDDLALVTKMLATRKPVSGRFAVARQNEMFLLNALLSENVRLDYLKPHDALIVWRDAMDGSFELLDIVAPEIPRLGDILETLGKSLSRLVIDFPPDLLGCDFTATPDNDPLVLMMRSALVPFPEAAIRLPEMAHF